MPDYAVAGFLAATEHLVTHGIAGWAADTARFVHPTLFHSLTRASVHWP
ncbi:hypothetical protein [Micromonospora sp. WMMD708]